MPREIHIVFDGPPGHESGRFVEVEDETGAGIKVGEWREVAPFDGPTYWHLVLKPDAEVERLRDGLREIDGHIGLEASDGTTQEIRRVVRSLLD